MADSVDTKVIEERVEQFLKAGFALFPLEGKHPVKGYFEWQNTRPGTYGRKGARRDGNFGVVLQHDDLVVDIDPRNFKPGKNPVKELVDYLGESLKSFTVQTGGGGLHIYFKKPIDFKIRKSHPKYPGVEFKTRGNYVVGPGSLHPDSKKIYFIKFGSVFKRYLAPKRLLELLKPADILAKEGLSKFSDDEQSQKRYTEYLFKAPIAEEGNKGDETTFKVACRGRDFGLSPQVTYGLMLKWWNSTCRPPWGPEDLMKKVANAYQYNADVIGKHHPATDFEVVEDPINEKIKWDTNKEGGLKKTLSNTINFFLVKNSDLQDLFKFNDFTHDIEFTRPAPWHKGVMPTSPVWKDSDAIQAKYHLSSKSHFEVMVGTIHEAAVVLSHKNKYHPVKDKLKTLPEWDGKDRLTKWLTIYAGVDDTPYTNTVGRKTLIAAISRIYEPGCKFDHVLVLEGKQGTGKSTLCRILSFDWFGDMVLDAHARDTIDAMRGKWIIEASEMEMTKRSETQALKAFITRQVDRVRLAYARNAQDFPRQCIFIGTTNPEAEGGYLKDSTGNRRFWPVFTRRILMQKMFEDREQIWAQALDAYKCGEVLYLETDELRDLAALEANKRLMVDPWSDTIKEWLETLDPLSNQRRDIVTPKEIWEECLGNMIKTLGKRDQIRLSLIMEKELGWVRGVYRREGKIIARGYKRNIKPRKLKVEDLG